MAKASRRQILSALGGIPILAVTADGQHRSSAYDEARKGRDKELFIEAVDLIAEGKYSHARLTLNTLRNVYSESPLVPQARLLTFFTYATESPRLEGGGDLLTSVDRFLARIDALGRAHSATTRPNKRLNGSALSGG